jgi:hypothetical protein
MLPLLPFPFCESGLFDVVDNEEVQKIVDADEPELVGDGYEDGGEVEAVLRSTRLRSMAWNRNPCEAEQVCDGDDDEQLTNAWRRCERSA